MIVASPFPSHWSAPSGGGGGIVRTSKGEWDSGGSAVTSFSSGSITISGGAVLVVIVTWSGGNLGTNSVSFAGAPMTRDRSVGTPTIGGVSYATLLVASLNVGSTTTGTISVTSGTALAISIQAVQVTGLASNVADQMSSSSGNSTTMDAGTTGTTATAVEYAQGAFFYEGTLLSNWTNSFTTGGQDGSWSDASLNTYTVTEGYRVLSATGTVHAALSSSAMGIWCGACVTYK